MAKESTNLGRTTVGKQTLLSPDEIAKLQADVKAQQEANPELAAQIESLASEVPVITDPTVIRSSGEGGGGNIGFTPFYQTPQVYTASDGKTFTDQAAYVAYEKFLSETKAAANAENIAKIEKTKSAYNLIKQEFESRGLGALIPELQTIMQQGLTDANEIRLYLQNTDAYQKRFIANQDRIKKGLVALTPAQYIGLEDQYQEIMRRYGLPSKYYSKNDLGVQEGFNKLIANDVSATELEDRVMTAQNRLVNADPNVMDALRKFYPNITKGDLLAYTLDPENTIGDIKRKVTAAEIGGAALAENLLTDVGTAEELAKYGVTKAQAREGYGTIAGMLPVTSQLADIYQKQGLGPYTQSTAEAEVFGTTGSAEAARKRKKLAELQKASFSGSSGLASNALSRDKASAYQGFVSPGAGSF